MTELSPIQLELSRKIERQILHSLSERGQSTAATALSTSESTISRMKDGQIENLSNLLAFLGLKVVPAGQRSVNPIRMKALCTLLEAAISESGISNLIYEGEE